MRILLASTALTLAFTAPGMAASIDLAALGLTKGAALSYDQRLDVTLDSDFGFYSVESVSDDPTIRFSTELTSLAGITASDISLSYSPKPQGVSSVQALEAMGSAWNADATGLAVLFDVTKAGDLTPGVNAGDKLYAVISGDFSGYTDVGLYTNKNAFAAIYQVAPSTVPLPASASLLLVGVAALGFSRRR